MLIPNMWVSELSFLGRKHALMAPLLFFEIFGFFSIDLLVVCKRILSNSSILDGIDCTKPPNEPAIKLCNNEIDLLLSRSDPKKRRQLA